MHSSASTSLVGLCWTTIILVLANCAHLHRSCIQAFEGSQNVRITNNRVGPAGIGADIDQGKWADGVRTASLSSTWPNFDWEQISFAGVNGLVAGNEIIDATDGAIGDFFVGNWSIT
jgi:hypothetical protein